MTEYEEVSAYLENNQSVWLISGVAGFIGSNLLEKLLILNQRVVGIDNFETGYQHNLDQAINRRTYVVNDDTTRVKKGVSINELVYEKHYTIEILKQKKDLFQKILFDYYSFQKKFFERIKLKLKIIFYHIEKDVEYEFISYSNEDSKIRNTKTSIETLLVKEIIGDEKKNLVDYFYSVLNLKFKKLFSLFCIYE